MRLYQTPGAECLTMIRHARSFLNDDIKAILSGEAERTGLNWESPLTPKGVDQAERIGKWLCSEASSCQLYHPLITSTQVRARITAGIVGNLLVKAMPNLFDDWEVSPELNERHFGLFNEVLNPEALRLFLESQTERSERPMSWKPLNGESLDQVLIKANSFLDKLSRAEGQPLIITSSWPIWAIRARIEDWGVEELGDNLADNSQYLGNCDGVQYRLGDFGESPFIWRRILHLDNLPESSESGWERVLAAKRRRSQDLLAATNRYRR